MHGEDTRRKEVKKEGYEEVWCGEEAAAAIQYG